MHAPREPVATAMSGMPALQGAPIDLRAYRAEMREELMSHLDMVPPPPLGGARALVLDPALSGPLGLIAEVKEFKEHGADRIYHLTAEPLAADEAQRVERGRKFLERRRDLFCPGIGSARGHGRVVKGGGCIAPWEHVRP